MGANRRKKTRRNLPDRREPSLSLSQTSLSLTQSTSFYTGPVLPPAEELAKFETVIPQGAERIFTWVVKQSENRMAMERAVVFSNISKESRAQWMAFTICMVVILIGGILVYSGKDIQGFSLILGPLIWLAGTFIASKVKGQRELKKKRRGLAERGIVEPEPD
ncbi:MAG TPA: DUF2335 domain-containing protein [Thermoanaerobaculia bacterium]|nr:DUF2335 domain-containing protein [Thermoanaerobaculia bacterium]